MERNLVTFDRDKLEITVHLDEGDLVVDKKGVRVSYYSEGPGGQNVNKSNKGVRLAFEIPEEHRRNASKTRELITRSMNERSQEQNFRQAFEQLADGLRKYFWVQPERKKTKTPKRAKERRLREKKMQGIKKKSRKGESIEY